MLYYLSRLPLRFFVPNLLVFVCMDHSLGPHQTLIKNKYKKIFMSSFLEHCNILWYILFHLLLSWMKPNIQTAYITFINALETREDNTMEKTGNSLSKNNAMEHHINQNFMSAQSLFQNNSFEGKPNSTSPPKFYLLLQSSYVAWFLQLWILEACRTSGKAIPPGADNTGRTNLRILKTSSTSCVLLCLWSFKGFEGRKPHCTGGPSTLRWG